MITWPSYSMGQAEKDFEKLTIDNILDVNLSEELMCLRKKLIAARDEIFDKYNFDAGISEKYTFDLEFGLALYKALSGEIQNRDIYTDDIWRYLSIRVVPDIVHSRWGKNPDRYYRLSRRIYLKQIWWYIHLSWDTDEDTTYNILKDNTTDTILNLVERPGLGYNIELYREIMKQYANLRNSKDVKDGRKSIDSIGMILRRVMVLNTARLNSIAPELVEGGTKRYVEMLFRDVM